MKKLVFDGQGAIFGRMSGIISKELLRGNFVELINSEQIIISGNGKKFAEKIKEKRRMGRGSSLKGPKYIRRPDLIVKRMIRGMLPRDRMKGREALKRLKCYVGDGNLPEETLKDIKSFEHKKPRKYSTIKQIMEILK
tara:strand:- start:16381 stop:16794 length:414 start_codon:yes stop_codon:yes gene_type:complete